MEAAFEFKIMKKQTQQTEQTLRIPAGTTLIGNAEKESMHGGARRPNAGAWKAGQALIGMQFFGVIGLGFFFL